MNPYFRGRWLITAAIIVGLLTGSARAWQSEATKATMRTLYDALTKVLIASLDDAGFRDPVNREEILLSLRILSANANRLEKHADELASDYDYLRRSLAKDCRDASIRYDAGEYLATQFVLMKLTENCVGCHSKQPPSQSFDLGKQFVEDARIEELEAEDRIKLQLATRQFDRAMETCETIMLSPETIPEFVAVTGIFEDYIKLAVRVDRNPNRAISTLEAFSKRPDIPLYMADLTATWIGSLEELELDEVDNQLDEAGRLIDKAREANRFPADQRGLVYFVGASSLLHSYLSDEPSDKGKLSEAYYLLGLAESHISRSYWLSESGFFLARAIRVAPKSDTAKKAFHLLEAYTNAAYTGSSGITLPSDVRIDLDELRQLVE